MYIFVKRMFCYKVTVIYVLIFSAAINSYKEFTNDQTSSRPNTLFDDADDIQKQLNNEAHDKMGVGKPKTVWVLHIPTEFPLEVTYSLSRDPRRFEFFRKHKKTKKPPDKTNAKTWSYKDQTKWSKQYPDCGGRSQSPVDLPAVGLVRTKGCRHLTFINYDVVSRNLKLNNDGKRLILYGEWDCDHQPVVYGGAAHSRRYRFHSINLHWPSEHRIGGLQYPLESQVIHISAEYKTIQDAVEASPRDSQAILGIVNLYKFNNHTQPGLAEILRVATTSRGINACIPSVPLAFFNPPLNQYVCYQGSLTTPPCTENVIWLIRAKALPIKRDDMDLVNSLFGERELKEPYIRQTQPLNDRKLYYFN